VQVPLAQAYDWKQGLVPVHEAPFEAIGFEQVPDVGSHVPAAWHESLAVHVTGFEPVQVPAWQESVCVHALPSLHVVPFVAAGFEQVPLAGSHVPTAWHWSDAVQVTGLDPVQVPL